MKYEEPHHQCYKCEEELVFEVKIGRLDTCPNCEAYLHSCRNCRFWSKNAHNECLEDKGEFIRDREAGNFCGHFEFRRMTEDGMDEQDSAKARLNALFGGGGDKAKPGWATPSSDGDPEDAARSRLEALFKK
jgi:hypothetical protein